MGTANRHGRILRATLCEIESGVFYVTYQQDKFAPDTAELPTYKVEKTVADAKQRIERAALALGYDGVYWKESIIAPLFPADTGSALHALTASHPARRGV